MYIYSFFIAEVSLLEARDIQGAQFYENTPPETGPIVIGDDVGRDEQGHTAQVATSSESNFTSIQEKGTVQKKIPVARRGREPTRRVRKDRIKDVPLAGISESNRHMCYYRDIPDIFSCVLKKMS